jgi:putative intracellular protease/amidase
MTSDTATRIVVPLPDRGFHPTETAIPWRYLSKGGAEVVFATEHGATAECDERLVGHGFRHPFPARPDGVAVYEQMIEDPAYRTPILYEEIDPGGFDAIHLTGGHAPGMRQYLESKTLQEKVLELHRQGKVIGAVCHGVLVLARTIDPATGLSILDGHTVTTLTKPLERMAFAMTFWRVGRHFRTYREYVEDEVRRATGERGSLERGRSMREPFVVTDREFITARYDVDAARYAEALAVRLRTLPSHPAEAPAR